MHSLQTTAAATLAVALLAPAIVLAVSYPVATVGVAALALAARTVPRALRGLVQLRRGQPRRICVPKTSACVEV